MVRICVKERSLTLVRFTHLIFVRMYVAPGQWSMACVLRQQIRSYYNGEGMCVIAIFT